MPNTSINLIEELAANAWRPEIEQSLDGWRLRYNRGVNRRCNSVWPNQLAGKLELVERLALVDQFYRRWGTRPRYQICPAAQPGNLARILAERGYTDDAYTAVQIATVDSVLSPTTIPDEFAIEIEDELSSDWFEFHRMVEGLSDESAKMRKGTLSRIGPQSSFAKLNIDGETAALSLGVFERGWLGIFCMATHKKFRQLGAASALLKALAGWGKAQGANDIYLQVMENNQPAISLYRKAGFKSLYQYYYAEGSQQ